MHHAFHSSTNIITNTCAGANTINDCHTRCHPTFVSFYSLPQQCQLRRWCLDNTLESLSLSIAISRWSAGYYNSPIIINGTCFIGK